MTTATLADPKCLRSPARVPTSPSGTTTTSRTPELVTAP